MPPVATATRPETVADLLKQLGDIPPGRVRLHPVPGTATEDDVLRLLDAVDKRICELVDGVLVEKAMGFRESLLAGVIIELVRQFLREHNLGLVVGADGMLRLTVGLVRIPDVSFVSWEQLPDGVPEERIPGLYPDLAVEVLSKSNTRAEMARKRREYFTAGTRLVWQIDPKNRTGDVYTSPTDFTTLAAGHSLDGGPVLPGFRLSLADLFAELDKQAPPTEPKRGEKDKKKRKER